VSVPVVGSSWSLHPSYQHVIAEGVSMGEAGVRVEKELHAVLALRGMAFVNTEAGNWIEGGVVVRPASWLSLEAGYASGRGYSLHRDVFGATADYLEENEASIRLGASVRLAF
jgi:carbohydrate-selective porin OprB